MHKRSISLPSSRSCQRGATYVEMAISIIVFMLIMISIIELLRFSFINVTIQHVVNESIRNAVVADFSEISNPFVGSICDRRERGYHAKHLEPPETRLFCIRNDILSQAQRLGLPLRHDQLIIKSRSLDRFESGPSFTSDSFPLCEPAGSGEIDGAGAPGDYVSICIEYPTTVLLGLDTTIRAFAIARNEDLQFETL